ncbi:unnamed protein product [Candidula unifasciata]|uniref:Polysaccharide pyruvyl transferase domain-containing protein n=1 Tax=Candidula unifasciata TaxID=100452 RepID=A0A8S3ZIE0_9EUPU|nr:unnamed protein product [Candidula unifasciata]
MNVVSHSIANIFKRFLVVLLLYMGGNRQITAMNFIGLCMSLCGLLVYTFGKTRHEDQLKEEGTEGERIKSQTGRRRTYLAIGLLALISLSVIGLFGQPELFTMSHPAAESVVSSTFRESYTRVKDQILSADFSHILKEETDPDMRKFLTRRLVEIPEDTDRRAKVLTSNKQVVEEAQRIHVNLFQDLLGKAKHVMLIELATYKNKGDPAIGVGEIMLLRRLNVTVVFYCCTDTCGLKDTLREARDVNEKYAKDELIILLQGGGNFVGYNSADALREKYISAFRKRRIILFSQSIWLHGDNQKELEYPVRVYSNRSNLIILLRDRQSLEIAKANFKGVQLILAPDMAFSIGMVPRQLLPIYDIVWLRRSDEESSKYDLPSFPPDISVDVNDWLLWKANSGQTAMEDAFLLTSEAFQFLQRGRVVVTDRLHGHILSTLLNIPHVLIDNPPYLKLSSYDKSWTASLWNTRLVSNGSQALDAAMELLRTYNHSLPPVGPRDMYAGSQADVRKQTL